MINLNSLLGVNGVDEAVVYTLALGRPSLGADVLIEPMPGKEGC